MKQSLLYQITNMGQPFIYILDANYLNRGELYLGHQWTGLDLDLAKAGEVLKGLRSIWGRPVHLESRLEEERMLLSVADEDSPVKKDKISERTARPGNELGG